MQFIDPQSEIKKLESDLGQRSMSLDQLIHMYYRYPDLKLTADGVEYQYYSDHAVAGTDSFSISEWEKKDGTIDMLVWPYKVIDGITVRPVNPYVKVASVNQMGFGLVAEPEWRVKLESLSMPKEAILRVQDLIDRRPAVNYLD